MQTLAEKDMELNNLRSQLADAQTRDEQSRLDAAREWKLDERTSTWKRGKRSAVDI